MKTTPLTLKEANKYVQRFHRHSLPTVGCKFAIGCKDGEKLVGVAICGRPIARLNDNGKTLEVLRVCTNGTKNAGSFLYDKARKIAALMGYEKVITYTLETESGSTMKALSAIKETDGISGGWNRPNRNRTTQDVSLVSKIRWSIPLLGSNTPTL